MKMKQIFAEIYGCGDLIEDNNFLIDAAKSAATAVGATVIGDHAVHYEPFGVTIIVFLAESHVLLTTWPENGLLLVDILLCNPAQDAALALDAIVNCVKPTGEVVKHEIFRVIAPTPS